VWGCPSSIPDSRPRPEALDLDTAFRTTPEEAEALERNRPGPMTLPEYARWLKQFHWTEEQRDRYKDFTPRPKFTLP